MSWLLRGIGPTVASERCVGFCDLHLTTGGTGESSDPGKLLQCVAVPASQLLRSDQGEAVFPQATSVPLLRELVQALLTVDRIPHSGVGAPQAFACVGYTAVTHLPFGRHCVATHQDASVPLSLMVRRAGLLCPFTSSSTRW